MDGAYRDLTADGRRQQPSAVGVRLLTNGDESTKAADRSAASCNQHQQQGRI